jgi:uncharacterized membrane protein
VGPVCVLGEACQAGGSCGVLAVIARSFSVPACHTVDSGKTGSIDAAMQWERPVDIWVYASIALYVVLAVVGLGLYSPVLKRQIANYEASGAATAEFTTLSARSRLLGMMLAVTVLLIIVLMVVKPGA